MSYANIVFYKYMNEKGTYSNTATHRTLMMPNKHETQKGQGDMAKIRYLRAFL